MSRKSIKPGRGSDRLRPDVKSLQRFLAKFVVSPIPADGSDPCWEWTGYGDDRGYGKFWYAGRVWWAHRWSYAVFCDRLADGEEVDHLCRNRKCVNPRHLGVKSALDHRAQGGALRLVPKDHSDLPF